MVLDIFVKGCKYSITCGYSGFSLFRCEVLRIWNQELGKLYKQQLDSFLEDSDNDGKLEFPEYFKKYQERKSVVEKIKKILDEYDKPYNEGMRLFAFHSDCDGEISPKECVLLLKSFGRIDPEKFEKSIHNHFLRKSYGIWLKMLAYAIENNKSIIFG